MQIQETIIVRDVRFLPKDFLINLVAGHPTRSYDIHRTEHEQWFQGKDVCLKVWSQYKTVYQTLEPGESFSEGGESQCFQQLYQLS